MIFDISNQTDAGTYSEYVKKWKTAMENAYEIARKRSSTAGHRNKHRYDLKLQPVDLQPNDRVLVRNLRERGGPGKLRSFWENEIHVVIRRKDPLSPVYEVQREDNTGPIRVLHRNLLPCCNDLPAEPDATPQSTCSVHPRNLNYRNRSSPRSKKRSDKETSVLDNDSSSEDEIVFVRNPQSLVETQHRNISEKIHLKKLYRMKNRTRGKL